MNANWKNEWHMPEFTYTDNLPFEYLTDCFRNEADRKKFAELMEQTVTEKTRSIWYPKLVEKRNVDKNRYTSMNNDEQLDVFGDPDQEALHQVAVRRPLEEKIRRAIGLIQLYENQTLSYDREGAAAS
jgi:hypothetical protein